jgi:hypothetical protein
MTRRGFFTFIAAAAMVLINGCASKVPYQETSFDKQNKALVYVYCPASTRVHDSTYDVAVNDIVVGLLYDNAYMPVEIETGNTTLYVQNHDTVRSHVEYDAVELKNVMAGDVYYVKAIVGQEGSFVLRLMDEQTAKNEIKNTGYLYDMGFKHFKLYKSNTNTTARPMEAVIKEPAPIASPKAHSASMPSPEYNAPETSSAPAAASLKPSASERIEKLYDLKEKGAITPEEYNILKAKILAE